MILSDEPSLCGEPGPVSLKNASLFALLLAVLGIIAYLPAFNNGFISDDYVIFYRLDSLPHNPWLLFSEPPECFRLTSYICFGMLRFFFGYHAAAYYGFNLLLHVINSLLVWRLVRRFSQSDRIGMLAAALFASAQGHQEAIMWLAAMNETLQGFFLLLCLVLWKAKRTVLSVLMYLPALFSKESALILMAILPWLERISGHRLRCIKRYGFFIAASIVFAVLFSILAARNFMINTGTYSLGFQAIPVFLLSMHRLLFPWTYLALVVLLAQWRWRFPFGSALPGLGFAAIALLPYLFLTYQNHITSRQEYLASIGSAWVLAVLIQGFKKPIWRRAFILIFVIFNIGYIWLRKDAQFEIRAAPTNRLVEILRGNSPQELVLVDFPGNPWIAKSTFRLAPGWDMQMIHVNPPASECPGCLKFRWDPLTNRYVQ
jgi:hypothetical protein